MELSGAVTSGYQGGHKQSTSLFSIMSFRVALWTTGHGVGFWEHQASWFVPAVLPLWVSAPLYSPSLHVRVSFHPHQTGPVSPNPRSDAVSELGSADGDASIIAQLRWTALTCGERTCSGQELGFRMDWRQEAWFPVRALPLTSCVVWGQMLGHSGPQWFVKLGCTAT